MVTVFLDVLGIGFVTPVIPALIGQFTTSPVTQAQWTGIILATYGVMQFLCAPILGALSDHFGRRPILLLSTFGLGMSFLVNALGQSLTTIWLIRILSGATGASFSVAGAYIADITPPHQRGKAFGMIGAASGLGFIIGPMFGGMLGTYNLRLPFYVAAGLSLINWCYGFFVLPESLRDENRTVFSFKRANPFGALFNLYRLDSVGKLVGAFAFTMLAQFIMQSTLVLYTAFRFNWKPIDNGLMLLFMGIVSTTVRGVLQAPLLKWLGEERLTLMGLTSAAIAYILYGSATHGWMMYVIAAGNLLTFSIGPLLQAMVSKAAPPSAQGLTMGSLNAISSIMMVVAPLCGMYFLGLVSTLPSTDWRMGATFYISTVLQGVALALASIHMHSRSARHGNTESAPTSTI